jgi:hypothetical protein
VGWSFRRSIKLGPLRLNLSRSGVGVSAGVKGFRVSTGARGTYVNAGRGGVSYRQKIGGPASRRDNPPRQNPTPPAMDNQNRYPQFPQHGLPRIYHTLGLMALAALLITPILFAVYMGGPPAPPPRFASDPHIEYVKGSKITVHFNASQNKTFYSQDDIKFVPPASTGVHGSAGKHTFEISLTAEATGKYAAPPEVTFTILHDFANKTMWHYPKDTPLSIEADAVPIVSFVSCIDTLAPGKTVAKCLRNEATKDDPTDHEFYDSVFFTIPLESFKQIGRARRVNLKFGPATFSVPEDVVASLKAFSNILSPETSGPTGH